MSPSLSLKTLLRTPFKTAITLLLIAAASFALFSRVADYAVSAREMSKVKDSYNGVIALDSGVPNTSVDYMYSNLPETRAAVSGFGYSFVHFAPPKALGVEQMNAFSSLTGVTSQTRYMTGGIVENMKRLNPNIAANYDWGYDYGARFVIEGTFVEHHNETSLGHYGSSMLRFTDIKQYGGLKFTGDGETIDLLIGYAFSHTEDSGSRFCYQFLKIGIKNVLTTSQSNHSNNRFAFANDIYREDFAESLVPGKRYLFIGRYIPNTFDLNKYYSDGEIFIEGIKLDIMNGFNNPDANSDDAKNAIMGGDYSVMPIDEFIALRTEKYGEEYVLEFTDFINGVLQMRLGDYDTFDYVPSFLELDDTENIAKAMEIADITNQDLHTFDIVYTENMAAIPRFNEKKMTITSGRAITDNDTDSCVISQYLADAYGLKLGDKLNIGLGDKLFEQYAQMGAIAYIPERRWNVAKTTEFEVVGVYKDIDSENERVADLYMGYSPNTIFVPMSQLPVVIPADHEIKPGEFSLFIPNADDFAAVMEKAEPLAVEFGLTLRASDGGYEGVKSGISDNSKVSVLTASLYGFSALLALILAVYLYIWRSKKKPTRLCAHSELL